MNSLEEKIKKARTILKKAFKKFPQDKTVIAWTGGKDSTVLLHIAKTTFNDSIPFPVMFNDSTMEFAEIYKFIKKLSKDWQLNLSTITHSPEELSEFYKTKNQKKKKELSRVMKVTAINTFVEQHKIAAFVAGIRWDEHEARSNETFFSKRKTHTRVHPILHFTEADIWEYIRKYNVPYVKLYDKGYRSLGEKPFTKKAIPGMGERSGREHDKEELMKKLRSLGYW